MKQGKEFFESLEHLTKLIYRDNDTPSGIMIRVYKDEAGMTVRFMGAYAAGDVHFGNDTKFDRMDKENTVILR